MHGGIFRRREKRLLDERPFDVGEQHATKGRKTAILCSTIRAGDELFIASPCDRWGARI